LHGTAESQLGSSESTFRHKQINQISIMSIRNLKKKPTRPNKCNI